MKYSGVSLPPPFECRYMYTSTDTIVANVRAKLLSVIIPPPLENRMSQLQVPVERTKMPTIHAVRVRHPLET